MDADESAVLLLEDQVERFLNLRLGERVDTGRRLVEDEHLERAAIDSAQAARLARLRFDAGAADLLEVLDAERTQLQAQDAFADARTASGDTRHVKAGRGRGRSIRARRRVSTVVWSAVAALIAINDSSRPAVSKLRNAPVSSSQLPLSNAAEVATPPPLESGS